MDHRQHEYLSKSVPVVADLAPPILLQPPLQKSHSEPGQRAEMKAQDPITVRKVQKADREKLRRDRLNEQFVELGNTLDPDRPKNDKATILTDTIQMLRDLTAEVNRLKAKHAALSEESRELMQEKNELREEKASLKSDIENLNAECHQTVRFMFPWTSIDQSVVMGPPHSYPVSTPIRPSPISIQLPLQPLPLFGNQYPGPIPNPCSTYVPFSARASAPVEQASAQYVSMSRISSKQESRSKPPDHERPSNGERCGESSDDVATKLELKMPGSSAQQDSSCGGRKERNITDGSALSRYSSSKVLQDSSNSIGEISKAGN